MFVHLLRRLRRALVVVLFLLLLAGSLAVALGLARLSASHTVRADLIPPPICPKDCPTTTATRADGGGLPPIWPGGGTLAQSTVAVVN